MKLLRTIIINLVLCAISTSGAAMATPSQDNKAWLKLQTDGTYALDANQYWRAEPLLKQALELSKNFGDEDLRHAKSLGELGRLYTIRGRFADAEPYLEQEYAIKERVYGKADGQVIPAMASLIKFYVNYGTASKSKPLTEQLVSFVEGKASELMAPSEPVKKFKKGMVLEGYAGEADSSLHPTMEWALACDEVAAAFKERGDLEMADRLYKAGLDIKASIVGKDHLALAQSYDCVGSICLQRGDSSEAASYFKDALRVTQTTAGANSAQIFSRIDKYARALIKEGKYGQAEQLYLRAQGLWKPVPENYGDMARASFALGSLYCQEKKFAQADAMLRKAVRLAEVYHGPNSVALVPYLEKYGYAAYYLGRKGEQERYKSRAAYIGGVM